MQEKEQTSLYEKYIKPADKCYQNGDFQAALGYYKEYVKIETQNPTMFNIIGFIYKQIDAYKNLDEQIKYFKKALELKPDFDVAVRNLAFANIRAGNYDEAVNYFEKLLGMNPISDDYFAFACLKIRLGDFESGWKLYEYRFLKDFGRTLYPEINKPRWEGQDISDKTLLVQYEQGFGDSIQFFRYLKLVKPLAKKIIFKVQKDLVELLQINENDIEVVSDNTAFSDLIFDYHIPLLSLPYILKGKRETIPFSEGYIKADENKVEEYKNKFFNNDKFKIGISWAGSNTGNKRRDVPFECFFALNKLENVQIYSFQKGIDPSVFKNLPVGVEIINLAETFNDFSDTASAMANLDLFVTSDNGVFNLAGAMGIKTFVLLGKDCEWRWFLNDKTTPWYKSVSIFKKQDENEDWDIQMNKIIEFLK